jgi:hypothetical protein
MAIVHSEDLFRAIAKTPVPTKDLDTLLEQLASEYDMFEDDVEGEIPDEDLLDEYNFSDDALEYDEPEPVEPFEETLEEIKHIEARYLFAIEPHDDKLQVVLLDSPLLTCDDPLLLSAILEHRERRLALAAELAKAQSDFFTNDCNPSRLANLNQGMLLEHMRTIYPRLDKHNLSRLLDALWFRIPGMGDLPARYFLRKMGYRTKLTMQQKEDLTRTYLTSLKNASALEPLGKAKGLVRFIEEQCNIIVELSPNPNEHDRYKGWKNLIARLEKEQP